MSGLSRQSAERILHRATELDEVAVVEHRGPTPEALRQAAAEVGISPAAMDRALAEERVLLALRTDHGMRRSLAGTDRLLCLAEGGHDAPARVDDALRRRAGFRVLSGGGATRRYERRSDPAAKLGRAVRRFKGTAWLERPPRVEVASAMFGERILVGIAADLRGERLLAEGAAGSLGVVGTAAAATLGLLASPWFLLVAPAALVAGGGIAVFRRASVAAAQRELDAFVAAALAPPPPAVAGPLGKLTRGSARSSTGRRSTAR